MKLMPRKNKGFTLVELLVVMAILGILATLIASGFRTAQMRGRDAQRKSDLKNIASSLELFQSDYGKYPDSSNGKMVGCSYNPAGTSGECSWGGGEFTDGKTVYFKMLPKDPNSDSRYYYQIVPGSNNQKFQVYAHLENPQDPDCIDGNCSFSAAPGGATCGGASTPCNFSITSANTTPTE